MSISTSANNIHHEILFASFNIRFERPLSQRLRRRQQHLGSSLNSREMQGSEEGADLDGLDCAGREEMGEREGEVGGAEVLWCRD